MAVQVVVLGGGYAGLGFIRGLRNRRLPGIAVTLVDQNPYHTLLTETHTVAAGSRPAHVAAVPFTTLGAGVRVVQARVQRVEPGRRTVWTDQGALPYDYLAFALGGADHDFGIPGVREHALFLRGIDDARVIRQHLQALPPGRDVLIVGGGLTGVELAAELALHHGRRRNITLVEAAPTLLPGLPPGLQQRARRRLGWLGVNVLAGAPVTGVAAGQVHLANGAVLPHSLLVWCAGVSGHPLLAAMGAGVDRSGRAPVDGCLRSDLPGVYILGDSAAYSPAPGAPPLPPSAQLAEQMGLAAAADLASRLAGGGGQPFRPRLRGILCDLGGLNAAGVIHRLQVAGLSGALAKRAAVYGHLWTSLGLLPFLRHLGARLRQALHPLPGRPGDENAA